MGKPATPPSLVDKVAERFRYYANMVYPNSSPLYLSLAMRIAEDSEILQVAAQAWEKKRVTKPILRRGASSSPQRRTSSTGRVLPKPQQCLAALRLCLSVFSQLRPRTQGRDRRDNQNPFRSDKRGRTLRCPSPSIRAGNTPSQKSAIGSNRDRLQRWSNASLGPLPLPI